MKATIFLLFISTYIATASRADFDRNGEGISRNKYNNPIESGPIPIPKHQGGIHPRNRGEPGFPRFEDPTIRMARPPKRQGNFGERKIDAMSDIRMAVPNRQGNQGDHDRNFGEPGFGELTDAKILACDLNKDGQLNSYEYNECIHEYGDSRNFERFLQRNFVESEIDASPKRQGTNNRNQQNNLRFENPSEIKTIVLTCDQDKDGQLNSKEFEECVSSMIYVIFQF